VTATHAVVLNVDRDDGPISGTLRVEHGPETRFSGWIELAALLERVRGDTQPASGFSPPRAPRPAG
jgi:hypothetical protein